MNDVSDAPRWYLGRRSDRRRAPVLPGDDVLHRIARWNDPDVPLLLARLFGRHPESTRTLRDVLHRGDWWAPFRTAALRRAAAAALRRIGSRDTMAVLDQAATRGRRGVRNAARTQVGADARRERARS